MTKPLNEHTVNKKTNKNQFGTKIVTQKAVFDTQQGMGTIELENMEFYAFHGCYKEEQVVGNKFIVNLTMVADCSKAAATDNVADSANYLVAYQIVKEQMEIKSHLLENVADRILTALAKKMTNLVSAKVKISKINPPLGGKVGSASVILERTFA